MLHGSRGCKQLNKRFANVAKDGASAMRGKGWQGGVRRDTYVWHVSYCCSNIPSMANIPSIANLVSIASIVFACQNEGYGRRITFTPRAINRV